MGLSVHSSLIYGVVLGLEDEFSEWGQKLGIETPAGSGTFAAVRAFAKENGLEIQIAIDSEYPIYIIKHPGIGFDSEGIEELKVLYSPFTPNQALLVEPLDPQVMAKLENIAQKLDTNASWLLTATLYV
jgi:hypothetical protein